MCDWIGSQTQSHINRKGSKPNFNNPTTGKKKTEKVLCSLCSLPEYTRGRDLQIQSLSILIFHALPKVNREVKEAK